MNNSGLIFCSTSIIGFLSGMAMFRFLIMKEFESYVSAELPSWSEFFPNAFLNIKKYYALIFVCFKKEWLVMIFIICLIFIVTTIICSQRNKVFAFLLSILSLAMMMTLCFGAYPFFTSPLFLARAMYGFGAGIAFIGIYIVTYKKCILTHFVTLALSWCFFIFAFTYGNALYLQQEYTDFRIESAIDDLKEWEDFAEDNVKTVRITGSTGYAPAIDNMLPRNKMLIALVPVTFLDSSVSGWSGYDFVHFYGLRNVEIDKYVDLSKQGLTLIEDNIYHTIRGNSEYIWIDLKNTNQNYEKIMEKLAYIQMWC